MSTNSYCDYSLFGLRVRSALLLPELFETGVPGTPDVWIERASITTSTYDAGLSATENGLLLTVPRVGRFSIEGGCKIQVDPAEGVDSRNLRLFLLGSAFGALLHQRGLLPIHANAVAIDGKAFAFMGPSGAGKSTLAAWFHAQGDPIVADDVCVVRFDRAGQPLACPGLPRLRLSLSALQLTGHAADETDRSYVGLPVQRDKFDLRLDSLSVVHHNMPLVAVCLLSQGAEFGIARLTGAHAAKAIFENTYRGSFVPAAKANRAHWESATKLVASASVFTVARTMNLARFDQECAAIREYIRTL